MSQSSEWACEICGWAGEQSSEWVCKVYGWGLPDDVGCVLLGMTI